MKCALCLARIWRERSPQWSKFYATSNERDRLRGAVKQREAINDAAPAEVILGGRSLCIQCWLDQIERKRGQSHEEKKAS